MGYSDDALMRSSEDRPPKPDLGWIILDGPDAIYMDQVSSAVFELLYRKGYREYRFG